VFERKETLCSFLTLFFIYFIVYYQEILKMGRVKTPKRFTSYVYRFAALSQKELFAVRRLKRVIHGIRLRIMFYMSINQEIPIDLFELLRAVMTQYTHLTVTDEIPQRIRKVHVPVTIESFTSSECWIRFVTRKQDLYRILDCLNLRNKNNIRMDNGSKFTGEEIMLFSLNHFVSPTKLAEMVTIYGKDWSQWDRAFNWFVGYMIDNFGFLLLDNLAYWQPQFSNFADKIRLKVFEKSDENIYYPPETFNTACFYDCSVSMICRPGAGPAGGGVNAPRLMI
jgi:hypothetical protein